MNELLYIAFVVLADLLAARWMVALPLGLMVPAGVFAIAPIFTIRDDIHRRRGRKGAYILIGVASAVSLAIAAATGNALLGRVTVASMVAFIVSESIDTEIYHRIYKRSHFAAVVVSNLFSAAADSLLFIGIAFGIDWRFVLGQYVVKMLMSVAWALIVTRRRKKR